MSLAVGVLTALLSLSVGTLVGAIAGFRGGKTDSFLMRVVDLFYIFPSLLIAILLTVFFGRGFFGILVALSLTSWVTHARLVRMPGEPFGAELRGCGTYCAPFGSDEIGWPIGVFGDDCDGCIGLFYGDCMIDAIRLSCT